GIGGQQTVVVLPQQVVRRRLVREIVARSWRRRLAPTATGIASAVTRAAEERETERTGITAAPGVPTTPGAQWAADRVEAETVRVRRVRMGHLYRPQQRTHRGQRQRHRAAPTSPFLSGLLRPAPKLGQLHTPLLSEW